MPIVSSLIRLLSEGNSYSVKFSLTFQLRRVRQMGLRLELSVSMDRNSLE